MGAMSISWNMSASTRPRELYSNLFHVHRSKDAVWRSSHIIGTCGRWKQASIQRAFVTEDLPMEERKRSDQIMREGSFESPLVNAQAMKSDEEQAKISELLSPADPDSTVYDVVVVGCGPAGLSLSAALAEKGLKVCMIGRDVPFVNNYGVWKDEFDELGLSHTLDRVWNDASCYFKEGAETKVGRAYGRVNRKRLRDELLSRCEKTGVVFYDGLVTAIDVPEQDTTWSATTVCLKDGNTFRGRMVTLASGGAAGRFLQYESSAPATAAQTAYGIEAEVSGYSDAFDADAMLFMDYRRHHTGLYPGTAVKQVDGEHPNGGHGLWGTENEVPSFLYAMPDSGNRVFLEETCLVSKPALPFSVLKRRLFRRCEALGIKIHKIHEEEWSYIPTGGPLPVSNQGITAFGAAANLVHPATGYSVVRTLREVSGMSDAISEALSSKSNAMEASEYVWEQLWSLEKRRQASFHIFGMELLCQLDLKNTSDFFTTFFALPRKQWEGFLASQLSSVDLITFALLTFAIAPANIKFKLVNHLATDPAGKYLLQVYMKSFQDDNIEE